MMMMMMMMMMTGREQQQQRRRLHPHPHPQAPPPRALTPAVARQAAHGRQPAVVTRLTIANAVTELLRAQGGPAKTVTVVAEFLRIDLQTDAPFILFDGSGDAHDAMQE
jgi:hypothetical protein